MMDKSQTGKPQSVQVIEADILDSMNETDASIAQRAMKSINLAALGTALTKTIGLQRNGKFCARLRSNAM